MKTLLIGLVAGLGFISGAQAQSVGECEWQARADAIVEPWEANSRTFANGNVRLALLDTIEPGAAAFHILVISPPYDELGGRQCRVVGSGGGMGFGGADFQSLTAAYDPSVGLMFAMNITVFDPSSGGFNPGLLRFTLNQANGNIDAWTE